MQRNAAHSWFACSVSWRERRCAALGDSSFRGFSATHPEVGRPLASLLTQPREKNQHQDGRQIQSCRYLLDLVEFLRGIPNTRRFPYTGLRPFLHTRKDGGSFVSASVP